MTIDGIAFDLEGTVVNLEGQHHEAHILTLRDLGVRLSIEEAIRKIPHFIGGPDSEVAKEMLALSEKKLSMEEVLRADLRYYDLLLKESRIQVRPGFLIFLAQIGRFGIRTAIGSLTDEKNARYILEKSGLDQLFDPDTVVLREDVLHLKPAPDVFLETARRMKVNPEKQLVFEDSPNGAKAAAGAGSMCIGMPVYNLPQAIIPLVNAGAKRIFMEWGEINAACLINNLTAAA